MRRRRVERIVLAYSGGASSTAAIPWLVERYAADVVTVTVDLDQRHGLEAIRARALAAGAVRAHIVDASDEFARDFFVPALRAGALSASVEVMLAALTQAAIAKHVVDLARLEDVPIVAHGGDLQRTAAFERLLRDLNPALLLTSPAVDGGLSSAELADYVRGDRRAPGTAGLSGLARAQKLLPDDPACVEVAFEEGVPISLNGVSLPLVELIASLDTIGGAHGVEPGAVTVLPEAHRALQSTLVAPDVDRSAGERSADYVKLVTQGDWYTAARREADALVTSLQRQVTGMARLRLSRGRSEVVECRSGSVRSTNDALAMTEVAVIRS